MTDNETTIANLDDAFDDWLAGTSLAKRSVTVYGKPNLVAEMQQVEEKLDLLDRQSTGEESVGDPERSALIERAEEIQAEWESSKSTWVVRALTDADTKAVEEIVGDAPRAKNPKSPTPEEKLAADAHTDALNLNLLARAVVEVRFADGRVADGVTYGQLEALHERLGKPQIIRLISEVNIATYSEPEVAAPKSRRSSRIDED